MYLTSGGQSSQYFLLVQLSSPGEGAMIVLLAIPTLAVLFIAGSVFGWPGGVTDAYDSTFLGFGSNRAI